MEMFKGKGKIGKSKFGQFVKEHAPELLQTVDKMVTGGKITAAVDMVKSVLGVKANDGDTVAIEAVAKLETMSPEMVLELEKLYVRELEITTVDKQDAREREKSFLAAGKRDFLVPVLAFVAVASFGFAMYIIAFQVIPEQNRELFVHCLGMIEGAMLVPVFQYAFGTTLSSKRKTEMLNQK